MSWVDPLFALVQSVVITTVLVAALGWRRPGAGSEAVWTSALFLLSVLFLVIWAVGAWIMPFGPRLLGREPFPFLFVGLVVSLLLLATMPRRRRALPEGEPREESTPGLPGLFWLLLAILLAALMSAYPDLTVHSVEAGGASEASVVTTR